MTDTLTRSQVRKIIKSKRGTMSQLARDLDVVTSAVTQALSGKMKIPRIMAACETKAREILAAEVPK